MARKRKVPRMVKVAAMSPSEFQIFQRGNSAFVRPAQYADKKDWILYASPIRKRRARK